jgi:hypothetical protein
VDAVTINQHAQLLRVTDAGDRSGQWWYA